MSKDVKSVAVGVGFDWQKLIEFITSLDWVQLMQFIAQVIAIFRNKPKAAAAGAGCTHTEAVKAHFEAIEALACCGKACCDEASA